MQRRLPPQSSHCRAQWTSTGQIEPLACFSGLQRHPIWDARLNQQCKSMIKEHFRCLNKGISPFAASSASDSALLMRQLLDSFCDGRPHALAAWDQPCSLWASSPEHHASIATRLLVSSRAYPGSFQLYFHGRRFSSLAPRVPSIPACPCVTASRSGREGLGV